MRTPEGSDSGSALRLQAKTIGGRELECSWHRALPGLQRALLPAPQEKRQSRRAEWLCSEGDSPRFVMVAAALCGPGPLTSLPWGHATGRRVCPYSMAAVLRVNDWRGGWNPASQCTCWYFCSIQWAAVCSCMPGEKGTHQERH